ncbi:MAG: DUF2087 domain-containing protein [Acidimicrobiales bacterium]|nr:DUF2087 domain-containing protein [Acidimicrobiales bacterium]
MPQLRLVDARDPAPDLVSRWFDGGRLVAIPTRRGKRLPVLDRLAQEFEPGVYYDERDVNDVLRAFHPDVAALRRYLVEEGFLDRTAGGFSYWRTGGSYPLA